MTRFARWTLVVGSVAALALMLPADAEARGGGGGGRSAGGGRTGGARGPGGGAKKSPTSKDNFLEQLQRDEADDERGLFRDDARLEVLRRLRAARRG